MIPGADRSVYRRRIEIVPSAASVHAVMEDHHHHFQVDITHDGTTVASAAATGVRSPWDTCAVGAAAIAAMAGLTIDEACDPRSWGADRSRQCTHVADLALLAIRHARDPEPLRYDVRFWPAARAHRVAVLERAGDEVMRWELDRQTITGPPPFPGDLPLERSAFLPWIRANLGPAENEWAMILRRAASISLGNAFDLDDVDVASDVHPADDTCHTYRAGIALTARRNRGTSRALEWS